MLGATANHVKAKHKLGQIAPSIVVMALEFSIQFAALGQTLAHFVSAEKHLDRACDNLISFAA